MKLSEPAKCFKSYVSLLPENNMEKKKGPILNSMIDPRLSLNKYIILKSSKIKFSNSFKYMRSRSKKKLGD